MSAFRITYGRKEFATSHSYCDTQLTIFGAENVVVTKWIWVPSSSRFFEIFQSSDREREELQK